MPLTALKRLENRPVSWRETGFDFIKTAHTFARHVIHTFALSKAKYPPAEWITLMGFDPWYNRQVDSDHNGKN